MGMQILTEAALRAEYERDHESFRDLALSELLPSALLGTAKAARGDAPFRIPQRWACQTAFKIAGWVDAKSEVAITLRIAQELGVSSLEDARSKLQLADRAKGVSLESAEARAVDLLRAIMQHSPERRDAIRATLFGEAVHVNGNGRHA